MGYEVLLTRLFSIILWHHFAYMLISVALLGYGAAGTFVAVAQRALLPRFDAAFATGAALFGVDRGRRLRARPARRDSIRWRFCGTRGSRCACSPIYGLLFVPFFCAATAICLTFTRFAGAPHRIYSFDISGAGLGSLGILAALFLLTPTDA